MTDRIRQIIESEATSWWTSTYVGLGQVIKGPLCMWQPLNSVQQTFIAPVSVGSKKPCRI